MAVLVTTGDRPPGARDWLATSLRGLAGQDYPDLRVVVVDTGGGDDPTEQVHAILPEAIVHRAAADVGFGTAANMVLADDGHEIRFFLFCHDDAAPEPGTVRTLVDAAHRCEAEVVGPKLVCWDEPRHLSQVGVAVTRTGVALPMVEPGELDQGQQDTVREVFAVPGAFTLVRADLFNHVGGFDEAISFLADDLSLCWRARVAGARVVLEPAARVRHRAALGHRIPLGVRRRLLARHRLRVVLTSYSLGQLTRVAPQAVLASLVEALVGIVTLRPSRAAAALGAWWWNLRRPGALWIARRQVRAFRRVDDASLRPLQLPGAVRPQLALRRHETEPEAAAAPGPASGAAPVPAAPTGGGDPAGPARPDSAFPLPDRSPRSLGDRIEALRAGWTSGSALTLLALVAVLLTGSRHLITRGVPLIGDLAAFGRPGQMVDRWLDGWRGPAATLDNPAPTALGLLGALGSFAGGQMGLVRTAVTLGLIPLGVAGAFRLVRPTGSPRAPVAAAVAYAAVPLPYTALAAGRWASLAAYAAAPWLLGLLAAAGTGTGRDEGGGADRAWTRVVRLGLVTALLGALVPWAPVLVLLIAGALALGSVLAADLRGTGRLVATAVGGSALALLLHLPFAIAGATALVGTDSTSSPAGGTRGGWWLGLGSTAERPHDLLSGAADLGFGSTGVATRSLWWALPVAAGLVLLVGRGSRLAWGVRAWTVVVTGWAGAQAVGWIAGPRRGIEGPLPDPDAVLAVVGAGLALAVGMGVAAAERDLAGSGWRVATRRLAAGLAGMALVAATVPLLESAVDGAWHMPRDDFSHALGFVERDAAKGSGRVLWVGDPGYLPIPGRTLKAGPPGAAATSGEPAIDGRVAYATSRGLPEVADLWRDLPDAAPEPIGRALRLSLGHETARLGRLLAPQGIEYVAVPRALAPRHAARGQQPPPPELVAALAGQLDLRRVDVDPALLLYRNTAAQPAWGDREAKRQTATVRPDAPARPTGSTGPAGSTGSDRYEKSGGAHPARSDASGASNGDRSVAGVATLGHTVTVTSVGRTLLLTAQAGLWLVVVVLALRRPRRTVLAPASRPGRAAPPAVHVATAVAVDSPPDRVRLLLPVPDDDRSDAVPEPVGAGAAATAADGPVEAPAEGVRVLSGEGAP